VFTAVAVLSLALGIGANTAIFELLDAVRLRTLSVRNPQNLAAVRTLNSGRYEQPTNQGSHPEMTNPLWEQVREHQQAFSGIFAWFTMPIDVRIGGEAQHAQGLLISGDFFNVLGVTPILGRILTREDDRPGCGSPGVVISYPFWQRQFAGEASALGKKIMINGHPFEVVGITPAGFFGMEMDRHFDVAAPICFMSADWLDRRDFWWLAVAGRLKPGWSLAQASAQLQSISPAIFHATAPTGFGRDVSNYLELKLGAFSASTGFSALREKYNEPLWLLLATAGLVLLIACANLANLMLARASAREQELAVRLALGASRGRVIRQLLAESLLLATAGGAVGIFLARNLGRFLVSFLAAEVDLTMDWRVLGFTAGLTMLTCVLFGLTPALRATSTSPGVAMKASVRGATSTRERFSLRRALVVAQVALSLALLVGALLFVRSLQNLLMIDTGYRHDGVLIAYLDTSNARLPATQGKALKQQLLERIRATSGVYSAATASIVPLRSESWTLAIKAAGTQKEKQGSSRFNWISDEFFRTMGAPLLAGRDFNERDTSTSPKAAIVNESFARKMLDAGNPIGQTFRTVAEPNYPEALYQVVGLVRNTKYNDIRADFEPIVFAAASQIADEGTLVQILIRSNAPLSLLASTLKSAIRGVSPDIAVSFSALKTQILEKLLPERLMAMLSGFFGFLAAVLATIGLYGVVSYRVVRRTNEIGTRLALGAGRCDIIRMILCEAGVLVGLGVGAGTVLALVAGRATASMLFNLHPYDPPTLVMAVGMLTAVALAASLIPALRAARMDPMAALRYE
jgi:predicted permease